MKWNELTNLQKEQFEKKCNEVYGETIVSSETGEPLYFDDEGRLIDTSFFMLSLMEMHLN
jgi:hypothetical protein